MAAADLKEVEKLVHSCGFYRAKSKAIVNMSKSLLSDFKGKLPRTIEALTTLQGVGRKTASVLMNQAFGLPAIAVDTHVKRVSRRLGWATQEDPTKIEFELRDLLPQSKWAVINGTLILHGRRLCKARKPLCGDCPLASDCPSFR